MKKVFELTVKLGNEKRARKIYVIAQNYGHAEEKGIKYLREIGFILKNAIVDFDKIQLLGKVADYE